MEIIRVSSELMDGLRNMYSTYKEPDLESFKSISDGSFYVDYLPKSKPTDNINGYKIKPFDLAGIKWEEYKIDDE